MLLATESTRSSIAISALLLASCTGQLGEPIRADAAANPGDAATGASNMASSGSTSKTSVGSVGSGGSGGSLSSSGGTDAGTISATAGGTSLGSAKSSPVATCDPKANWKSPPLLRLSQTQYPNVLAGVLRAWAPNLAAQVLAAPSVSEALREFPNDTRTGASGEKHGGFRRLDQAAQQAHADSSVAIARAVGAELTNSSQRVQALLGACSTDSNADNDATCVTDFIRKAGRRAERRVLTDEDVNFYSSVYAATGIDAAGLADVITVMLSGPYFMYQVEHGAAATDAAKTTFTLSNDELVNRLALRFWNTAPDDALLNMADQGSISTDAGYQAALDHVLSDPRSAAAFGDFVREWLSVEDLEEMNRFVGAPKFDAMRRTLAVTGDTRKNMIDEITRMGSYYETQGTFADLFTSTKSFATTSDLAAIYGVTPWSGAGTPPDFQDSARYGLLGRAALLATGAPETRPIMKGVFIRAVLLCDVIPPPPANAMAAAMATEATLDPSMSTRQRTESITQAAGTSCVTCHRTLLNPLGFVTENFDALGRLRASEPIFDEAGKQVAVAAIDTTTTPEIAGGDTSSVSSLRDLVPLLLASQKPQACFARRYFRHTFERIEDAASDGCALEAVAKDLISGQPLQSASINLAKSAQFKQRRFD